MARDRPDALIRLFISDIDGTLVRRDKSLSEATVAAFGRLAAAGIPATLISARPPSGIVALARRLSLTLPLGAFNGGTLFDPDGAIRIAHRLAPDVAADILARFAVAGVARWVFADGLWFASDATNPHLPRERIAAALDPIVTTDFRAVMLRIDKIVAVSDDPDLVARLESEARTAHGASATIARSQPYYLDVTAPVANKGDGVAALAAAAGVPLDQVAVAGDMPNDLPMFARAATSIAMGQAPEHVRRAATFVTDSTESDGLATAIDQFLTRIGH